MLRYLLVASLMLMPAVAAAQTAQRYQGLALLEVLRVLQGRGLRIVFSSETVSPTMRVVSEPRGRSDRALLDELLAPHGLRVRGGPGGTESNAATIGLNLSRPGDDAFNPFESSENVADRGSVEMAFKPTSLLGVYLAAKLDELKKPGGSGFDRFALDTPPQQRKLVDEARLRAGRLDDD